jgi:glutathione S-transferase
VIIGPRIGREVREMKLFFAPLACSLATRIALYECEADAEFERVDIHSDPYDRPLRDGFDFRAINPMGQVPTLVTDDGQVITENPAVLLHVAESHPASGLAARNGERYRLFEWLNFIAAELHKATFIPLLDPKSPPEVRDYAKQKLPLRFGRLERHLVGRSSLLERFTVADCYLVTVLNWSPACGIDLSQWPAIKAYFSATTRRPAVARALQEEGALWYELQKKVGKH